MHDKYKLPGILTSIFIMLWVSSYSKTDAYPLKRSPAPNVVALDALRTDFNHNANNFDNAVLASFENLKPSPIYKTKPIVTTATKTNTGIRYTLPNGDKVERCGGSIAWRNNNPGCIRYSKNVAKMGAIGKAYGFAIFPDEETGMRAIKTLLLSDAYCDLTISGAINKYAPPHENNTARYINSLCGIVGVSRDTRINELNDEQITCVVKAIRRIEGWIVGTETITYFKKPSEDLSDKFYTTNEMKSMFVRKCFENSI